MCITGIKSDFRVCTQTEEQGGLDVSHLQAPALLSPGMSDSPRRRRQTRAATAADTADIDIGGADPFIAQEKRSNAPNQKAAAAATTTNPRKRYSSLCPRFVRKGRRQCLQEQATARVQCRQWRQRRSRVFLLACTRMVIFDTRYGFEWR